MKLITALATPFLRGKLDLKSYARLVQSQNAADALLCCGTTAEGSLLSPCEKKLLIKIAKSLCPDKEIWVGISNGATAEAVKEATTAEKTGAEGLLVTPPAFFKCTEEGFVQHVLALQSAVDIPLMLYNAPSRTNYVLWKNAVKKLADCGVPFIKDAGSDVDYAREISTKMQVFCGNEELLQQFVQNGAVGVVSVVSNVAPRLVKSVLQEYAENAPRENRAEGARLKEANFENSPKDNATAANVFDRLCENRESDSEKFRKLAKLAFCELNPVAVKYMLKRSGIFDTFDVRLPLTAANEQTQEKVNEFWEEYAQ